MATAAITQEGVASVLAARWEAASKKFILLATEIPDSKLDAHPIQGTRTAGEVLRHVAYWTRYVADSLLGRKADDSGNELPQGEFPNKASLLPELERGGAEIAKGINSNQDGKAVELMSMALEHLCEHYGQLAVYARLLGIVPPASRS